jgi:hypothetical protein
MADEDSKARKSSKPAKKKAMRIQPASVSAKPGISDIIGRRLRTYYDEVAAQPVPDRFLELLAQLEAKSPRKTAK